jgi:hypothetical protein
VNAAGIISVLLVAATKFLFAPSVALGAYKYTYWETIFLTVTGGIAGATAFYMSAGWLMNMIARSRARKDEQRKKEGTFVPRKKFTPFRRKVIRIKNKFGLIGIAFATPCILSIPIGCILAARLFSNAWKTLSAIYVSVIVWAFFLTTFNDLVLRLIAYISDLFH